MPKKAHVILFLVVAVPIVTFLSVHDTKPSVPETMETRAVAPSLPSSGIDQIDIERFDFDHGAYRKAPLSLRKTADSKWRLSAPVDYPANTALVNDMLVAIGKMRLEKVAPPAVNDQNRLQLDDPLGVRVRLYTKGHVRAAFVVGVSRDKRTYVKMAGDPQVYQTPGLFRKVFDRSANQLRRRRIFDFDGAAIKRISYQNDGAPFTLARGIEGHADTLWPVGPAIRNFDVERAAQHAWKIARLYARGFYDQPYTPPENALRVTVEAVRDGVPTTVDIAFGAEDPATGLHYLTVSTSPQVFLVSEYQRSLFFALPKAFERTDEEVAAQRAWKEKAATHLEMHEARRRAVLQDRKRAPLHDDDFGADPHLENHVE